MAKATFFLSAGRCGTQTLAAAIKEMRPDAVVEHEPIGADYRYADKALAHLERVRAILDSGQDYIETGWPSWAWLPVFKASLELVNGEYAEDRCEVCCIFRRTDDQVRSLRAHQLDERDDDYAALIPHGGVKALVELVLSMSGGGEYGYVHFEKLFGPQGGAIEAIAEMLGITDIERFSALLKIKVDRWPTKEAE